MKTGPHYWLYGQHPVQAALKNPERRVLRLVMTKNAEAKLPGGARQVKVEMLEGKALEKLLPADAVHQGIAALVEPLPSLTLEEILDQHKAQNIAPRPLLLLDQVTDPHNVGAILRSAAAFGVAAVITTSHHSPGETAVLAKAAAGALDIVPLVQVTNLVKAMEELKQAHYWCVGLDGEAKDNVHDAKLGQNTALVLGAEGKGMRRLTREHCDRIVKLPMDGRMESLNVSNAAAIALYTLFTQRGQ